MNQRQSILLADDEDSFVKTTAALLRGGGYRCDCAGDADQAIEMLRAACYDLLIADIKMPGNRNLRLAQEARRLAPRMPVILVTGYPTVDSAVRSIHLPVAAYLTKPVDYDDLRRHVRAAIERSHTYRAISRIREHLEKCVHDLKAIEQGEYAPTSTVRGESLDISTFTVRTLAECLSEMLRLRAETARSGSYPDLCDLLDCPQKPILREAVRETIDVLQKTRARFKSNELRDLRIRLEGLLEKSGNPAGVKATIC